MLRLWIIAFVPIRLCRLGVMFSLIQVGSSSIRRSTRYGAVQSVCRDLRARDPAINFLSTTSDLFLAARNK